MRSPSDPALEVVAISSTRELSVDDTLGILAMPGVAVERSSEGLGWSRMYLSVQEEEPYRAEFSGADNHLLILHLDGPVEVTRGTGTSAQKRTIGSGGLFLQPAGRDLSVALSGRLRTLHMYLDDSMVADAAGRHVEPAEEIGSTDPLLEQLMLALDSAVQLHNAASRLYVDSLGTAVGRPARGTTFLDTEPAGRTSGEGPRRAGTGHRDGPDARASPVRPLVGRTGPLRRAQREPVRPGVQGPDGSPRPTAT